MSLFHPAAVQPAQREAVLLGLLSLRDCFLVTLQTKFKIIITFVTFDFFRNEILFLEYQESHVECSQCCR